MTEGQARAYWRMFGEICVVLKWSGSKADMDEYRRDWHEQSGLGRCSVTTINHLDQFDELIKTHLAITDSGNVNAQMRMANMPRTRLLHKIRSMAHPDFIQGLLESDRFKARALEDLNDKDLSDFRLTLAARVCSAKREVRETVAAADAPAIYAPPGQVPPTPAPDIVCKKEEQPF